MRNKIIYLSENKKDVARINYPLVKKFLKEKVFSSKALTTEDKDNLTSEINYRYCYSIYNFDEAKGFKLSTYVWYGMEIVLNDYIHKKNKRCRLIPLSDCIYDLIYDNKNKIVESDNISALIKKVKLREIERFIINQYFFEKLTLKDIGSSLNISKERVRQIKKEALIKIRKYFELNDIV